MGEPVSSSSPLYDALIRARNATVYVLGGALVGAGGLAWLAGMYISRRVEAWRDAHARKP